jgi:glucose 1-dehydrogenase
LKLNGKIALVTGAGTGIGRGIAVELGKRGARVAVHYNRSDSGALETKRQIEAEGGEAVLVQADVSNAQDIQRMMQQTVQHFGGLDILVNNAALQLNIPFLEYTGDLFDRMMNTNLKGYWQCIQAAVPHMKQRGGGRIVIISSVHAKRATDFDPVYAMTKGGIRMLGRESAIELAKYNITVNMIEPGAVDVGLKSSPETRPFYTPEEKERIDRNPKPITAKFPLGRRGLPSDVASLVCYIVSDECQFMTGSAIRLDGGSMLL